MIHAMASKAKARTKDQTNKVLPIIEHRAWSQNAKNRHAQVRNYFAAANICAALPEQPSYSMPNFKTR